ncbi:hypothetical protein KHQ81_15890 (plasmid) [Mycoplasmatota bacterium]|nr:hypothetical protein KHQ81_15890 [Mycoplasmatota bacterium]
MIFQGHYFSTKFENYSDKELLNIIIQRLLDEYNKSPNHPGHEYLLEKSCEKIKYKKYYLDNVLLYTTYLRLSSLEIHEYMMNHYQLIANKTEITDEYIKYYFKTPYNFQYSLFNI